MPEEAPVTTIVLPSRRFAIAEEAIVRKGARGDRADVRAESDRKNRDVRSKSICVSSALKGVWKSGVAIVRNVAIPYSRAFGSSLEPLLPYCSNASR
jgi:hypothetical protein